MCSCNQRREPELLPPAVLKYFDREKKMRGVDVSIPADGLDLKAYLFTIEKQFYFEALDRVYGNRADAAKLIGLNPPAFRKALRNGSGLAATRTIP